VGAPTKALRDGSQAIAITTKLAPCGAPPPLAAIATGAQLGRYQRRETEQAWLLDRLYSRTTIACTTARLICCDALPSAVIARLDRATQYCRASALTCDARTIDALGYWITRLRG
jgi:hypothetical protein